MKRVLRFLIIGLLAMPACALAQVAGETATNTIGYTNGDFNNRDGVRLEGTGAQRAAIRIPAAKLERMAGAKVTAIKGVFGTRNLDGVTFFITADLDGQPLYEQQLSGFGTTWREYALATPFEITGETDLYFGYTITCSDAYSPLAFDRQYSEPGCNYGYVDGQWADLGSATYGNLNLQLIVEGVPQFTDATVRPFRADSFYRAGTEYSFQGQLFNFGTETITSFSVASSVDGGEVSTQAITGVSIEPGQTYNFDLEGVEATDYGYKGVNMSISDVNGGAETLLADNKCDVQVYFYPQGMPRNFLVENFTGQTCGNCPGGHLAMEDAIERSGESVVAVSYHLGFEPDDFTMMEDAYYLQFYGVKAAPSFMVNRFANPAISSTSPVFEYGSMTTAMILDCIEKQAAEQPYVGVYINTNYDEQTRRLTGAVDIVAYRDPNLSNPSLQLLLVQDSIVGNQDSYTTGLGGSNYMHRHVNRGSLNGTFGEKLGELSAGAVITKEIDYTLPETITSSYDNVTNIATDPKQMYLVAIVGNIDSSDPANCLVLNCAQVKFGSSTVTGISSAPASNPEAGAAEARLVGSAGSLRAEGNFDALYIYNVSGKLAARCSAPGQALQLEPGVYVTRAVKGGATATAKCVVAR